MTIVPSDLCGLHEFAQVARVPIQTVRVWKSRGELPTPFAEVSGRQIWLRSDVERWVSNRPSLQSRP